MPFKMLISDCNLPKKFKGIIPSRTLPLSPLSRPPSLTPPPLTFQTAPPPLDISPCLLRTAQIFSSKHKHRLIANNLLTPNVTAVLCEMEFKRILISVCKC